MVEYLAIPARDTPPTRVDAWVARLAEAGAASKLARESSTATWIDVASPRLRGYILLENGHAAAINFELHDRDPAPAIKILEDAAAALGWEIHPDDEDSEDDPDDDDDPDD